MKVTKAKIIVAAVVLCTLGAAFFLQGNDFFLPYKTETPVQMESPEETAFPERNSVLAEQEEQAESENGTVSESAPQAKDSQAAFTPQPTEVQSETEEEKPAEPKEKNATEEHELTCNLSVSCAAALEHMDKLDPAKRAGIPEGGIIFPAQRVTFYEGETVFHVLQREMKKNKIHMEFVNTPMYRSAYIEGIYNLYEGDCGELSGWLYCVNGTFPGYACSQYSLSDGDTVEIIYTCDSGRDVGGERSVDN